MQIRGKSIRMVFVAFIVTAALVSSCAQGSGKPGGEPTKAQATLPTVLLKSGNVELLAEVAKSDAEKTCGLMFRQALDDGKGMIFVYYDDSKLTFWMKNTLVPLSVGYLSSEGVIREILDMQPLSLAPVPSSHYVRYALEVPQGWFGRAGLSVGDKFELPAGFPPK